MANNLSYPIVSLSNKPNVIYLETVGNDTGSSNSSFQTGSVVSDLCLVFIECIKLALMYGSGLLVPKPSIPEPLLIPYPRKHLTYN